RIEHGRAALVYATDYEHGDPEADRTLLEYSDGADLLVCDSQYTPEEYRVHRGWGHSTWEHAASVANRAGVRQLILFHHDPSHDDAMMLRIAEEARAEFANTVVGSEGLEIAL